MSEREQRERLVDLLQEWGNKENDGVRAESIADYLLERMEKELTEYKLRLKMSECTVDEIKSEAIKEFAEQLKRYSFVDNLSLDGKETVYIDDIDNLVKKMTKEK